MIMWGVEEINKIIGIGNLGRDPEMQYTPSGQAVTKFTVASNRKYTTGAGEPRSQNGLAAWAWGKLAETCNQYLVKGHQVYLEGRVHLNQYEGRDVQSRSSLEVTIQDIQFLGKSAGQGQDTGGNAVLVGAGMDDVDDLPF